MQRCKKGNQKVAHRRLKLGKHYSRAEVRWVPMAWASHTAHRIIFTALQNAEPPRSLSSPWPYCPSGTSAKLQEPLGFLTTLGSLHSNGLSNRQEFLF